MASRTLSHSTPAQSGRVFLPASAGAAPPLSALARGRDARLIELQERHLVIEETLLEIEKLRDRAEQQIREACPPPPELAPFADDKGLATTFDPLVNAKALARFARRHWSRIPPSRPPGLTEAQREALLDSYVERIAAACRHLGYGEIEPRTEALTAEQDRVLAELLDTPAETIIGIIAKLRVIDDALTWLLERGKDEDYHACLMRRTLREAERIAAAS